MSQTRTWLFWDNPQISTFRSYVSLGQTQNLGTGYVCVLGLELRLERLWTKQNKTKQNERGFLMGSAYAFSTSWEGYQCGGYSKPYKTKGEEVRHNCRSWVRPLWLALEETPEQ